MESTETFWQSSSNFNYSKVTKIGYLFNKCYELEKVNLGKSSTPNLINMEAMFQECHKIKSVDLSNFNYDKVNNMRCLFSECKELEEVNLGKSSTPNLINMVAMFNKCHKLKSVDIYSLLLFVLYKTREIDEYSALSELAYVDQRRFLKGQPLIHLVNQ